MTSKPAASHVQALDRDEPLEAAKIPLRNKGLDIASHMRSVKQAEQRRTTIRRSMSSLWWRDSNQTASGNPGAVQILRESETGASL